MGVDPVTAALVVGTAASLYGQNRARKEAKKQNEQNRRDAIMSEIMSIVSGKGPAGISPQQVSVPNVDYGGAIANLAQTGYQLNRQGIEDQRYEQQQQRQASLDAQAAAESQARQKLWNAQADRYQAQSIPVQPIAGDSSIMQLNPFTSPYDSKPSVMGPIDNDVWKAMNSAPQPSSDLKLADVSTISRMFENDPAAVEMLAQNGNATARAFLAARGGGGGPQLKQDPYAGMLYPIGGITIQGINPNAPSYRITN